MSATEENIDFDRVIDRNEVRTLKFDGELLESVFGRRDLWPSWVADMDFTASRSIQEALARRVEHGIYGYESDTPELPEAVARWYGKRHGWSLDPDHLVFSHRTLNSIAVLIELFSWCNPHNPIGRVWSAEELTRLAEICAAHDVLVIADEIHGDITYRTPYTPLASLSREAALNCASCISPVKSFNLAGVANSMIVIEDEEKRKRCRDWFSRFEVNKNNVFTTAATLAAYTRGGPWLDRVIDYLAGNIEALRHFLEGRVPAVRLIEPEGTFLVWLDFRELGLDARQLESFLADEAGMATNPGHWFGREGAGFARLNIACPRSVLMAALERLEQAVHRHLK